MGSAERAQAAAQLQRTGPIQPALAPWGFLKLPGAKGRLHAERCSCTAPGSLAAGWRELAGKLQVVDSGRCSPPARPKGPPPVLTRPLQWQRQESPCNRNVTGPAHPQQVLMHAQLRLAQIRQQSAGRCTDLLDCCARRMLQA